MKGLYGYTWLFAFLALHFTSIGQDTASASTSKAIYRQAWTGGFIIHTRGIGGHYRYERFRGSRYKQFIGAELYNIKHPKEQKSFNPGGDESNSFIYGKLNHAYVLRGGVGRQKIMFEKLVDRGVQISSVLGVFVDLAIVKPIYLEIVKIQDDIQVVSTERYDPYIHPYGRIVGRGPWLKGFGDAQMIPGLGLKAALNFEFAPEGESIKALEIGANLDGFTQPLPLMAFNTQYNIHLNLYLNFQFGKKSFL